MSMAKTYRPRSFEPDPQEEVYVVFNREGQPIGGLVGTTPVSLQEAEHQAAKKALGSEERTWVWGDKVSGPPRIIGKERPI